MNSAGDGFEFRWAYPRTRLQLHLSWPLVAPEFGSYTDVSNTLRRSNFGFDIRGSI